MTQISKKLTLVFSILFFGAIWGILEATVGTFLHLPFIDKAGIFACSTTIMLPLAYLLMGLNYKKNHSLLAILGMGVIASLIKFSLVFIMGFRQSVYMPAIYILLEASAMVGAIALMRPTHILSSRYLVTTAIGTTTYLFIFLLVKQMQGMPIFTDAATWVEYGEYYLFKGNFVALMYTGIVGSICYGFNLLMQNNNLKLEFPRISKIIYHPATSLVLTILAVVTTLVLK